MTHLRPKDLDETDLLVGCRVIAAYPTYLRAHDDVAHLVALGIRREELTIVAEDLRFADEGAPRSGVWRAVLHGLLAGGVTGGLFGFLFGLLSWVDPLISGRTLALYGFAFGSAVGALLATAAHWLSDGSAVSGVDRIQARRYAVLATEPVADDAARLVRTLHRPRAVR